MGDVKNVNNLEGFSKRQRLFIEWLATPKYGRIPPTQEMLADQLGVRPETLCRWKRVPGLMDAAVARARSMVHDNLPEIYGALNREASKGSFQHIKLALEVSGEHVDKKEIDLKGRVVVDWDATDNAES